MICKGCKRDLPEEEFVRRRGTGLSPRCNKCRDASSAAVSRWIKRNPDKQKAHVRDFHNRYYRNITTEEYTRLLELQEGKCAICGNSEDLRHLAVDHCHKTGVIRGLLCLLCNTAIGRFKDKPELLLVAIAYLERHQKNDS